MRRKKKIMKKTRIKKYQLLIITEIKVIVAVIMQKMDIKIKVSSNSNNKRRKKIGKI
jgi:hypothetical protein